MRNLKPSQLKALSEFLNTVAAAWFSAGVIVPLFSNSTQVQMTLSQTGLAIFLTYSLYAVKEVKL